MENVRLLNPNLSRAPTNTEMGFLVAKGFNAVVEGVINFYQNTLAGKIAPTTPNFAAGMVFLTGQPSTSEWTRQEISRLKEPNLSELFATLGVALLFISKANFVFFPPDENSDDGVAVNYPSLSANATISFVPSNTHIVINPEISTKEAGKLLLRGSWAFLTHLGGCLASTSFGKDRRVNPNERIISIKKGGWGEPSIAQVEVQDIPPHKGGWGEESTPGKTHVEERIEFKGRFIYKPKQVTTVSTIKGW